MKEESLVFIKKNNHKNGIATILLQEFYTRQHKFARSVGASVSEKVGMD